MCMPGAAITLKGGLRPTKQLQRFRCAPSSELPTGWGSRVFHPSRRAFANAIAALAGKPFRALPFKLG
jgi:isoquinoline 1-oxidoreductase beta subunit